VLVANVVDEVSSFGLDVVVVHHLAVHQRLVVAQQVPTEIV
jgi:putative NIF3 family GTP cyclohydrolase 1 type 2